MAYTYEHVNLIRIVDGDTVILEIDFGFKVGMLPDDYRLYGIDAPELRGETREAGLLAKEHLGRLLEGQTLRVTTYKNPDKYGRYLVDIFVCDNDGAYMSVNQKMIEDGYAKIYSP